MSAGEAVFWVVGASLWLLWIAWIIADAIENTRMGWVMESIFLRIARPIDRALQRTTATRK